MNGKRNRNAFHIIAICSVHFHYVFSWGRHLEFEFGNECVQLNDASDDISLVCRDEPLLKQVTSSTPLHAYKRIETIAYLLHTIPYHTHRDRQSEIGSGPTDSSRKTKNNSIVFCFVFVFHLELCRRRQHPRSLPGAKNMEKNR